MNLRKNYGYVASLLIIFISLAITSVLMLNRQSVVDHLMVWQYKPGALVDSFVERTAMNEKGKFLLFTAQPAVESTQIFNEKCARIEQSTAILGCYTGTNIYIYNIQNTELDGIREVTAAHEMLHVAYARLSTAEKEKVDALVDVEYKKLQNNKTYAERMAFYARTEPGERNNELHSIIGTEIATVSPELEAHYGHYFMNRHQVLALHEKYASIFTGIQARSDTLIASLDSLARSIESRSDEYNRTVNKINNDITAFNTRATSGEFTSEASFNTARSQLVDRVGSLETLRASIAADREEYERLRRELISISSESEALNRSINSSLAPAPSL